MMPLDVAALLLEQFGAITGKGFVELACDRDQEWEPLLYGRRGELLLEPLRLAQTKSGQLLPDNRAVVDGIEFTGVMVDWPATCRGLRERAGIDIVATMVARIARYGRPDVTEPSARWFAGTAWGKAGARAGKPPVAGDPEPLQARYDKRITADWVPRVEDDLAWAKAEGFTRDCVQALRRANPDPRLHRRGIRGNPNRGAQN